MIVPAVGRRLICEDEHAARFLLDGGEVIEGHHEVVLDLRELPLQNGAGPKLFLSRHITWLSPKTYQNYNL